MVGSMKTFSKPTGAIRLEPCHYGLSRVSFRGPRSATDGRFVACLGGSDTFAKYVAEPYPKLIEKAVGEVCVNLGCQAAGPDVFLADSAVQAMCHDAVASVVEVLGAANLTNAYYSVHPRRNDRFIGPTDRLVRLFPEVDFSEISFTGHLMKRLMATDMRRFALVRAHLQSTWVERMVSLVSLGTGPVFLLWFAPSSPKDDLSSDEIGPQFVTRHMIEILRNHVDDVIEVVEPAGDVSGLVFPPLDAPAAAGAMGVQAHIAVSKALGTPIMHCLS